MNEAIKTDASHLTTGILDIYGFEIFGVNSFEQLCINYANEKLQQLFIELTVLSEQQEYAEEGIAWTPVPFFDNRVVCELIEGTKPAGVFAWLDEECVMPQGSDTTLYEKLAKNLVSHKHFAATTEKDLTKALFTITHYAGDVGYSPAGMLEKNRDTLFRDLHEMIAASAKPFVAQLLGPLPGKATQKRPVTAGFQFRQQMGELVKVLGKCEPHYIRCIKPNDHKKSPARSTPTASATRCATSGCSKTCRCAAPASPTASSSPCSPPGTGCCRRAAGPRGRATRAPTASRSSASTA